MNKKWNSVFEDPLNPTWSSYLLERLHEDAGGTIAVVRILNHFLGSLKSPCTEVQINLIQDCSKLHLVKNGLCLARTDLQWLLDEFRQEPTACRATILAGFIVLNEEEENDVKELVKGTRAHTWL